MKTGIKILQNLKDNPGIFVSGEKLGGKFNISRTAVWKNVQRLKARGYLIEACKKEGYRLTGIPDFLLPPEIQDGLKTKFIGKKILHFKEVDSTNEQAKKTALKGTAAGTVLIAEKQTKGKGRLGKHWTSPTGGIWMSFILRPEFAPREAPLVTMVATLAVAGAIKEITGLEAWIKWPNDVVAGNRQDKKNQPMKKICGILTEMTAEVDRINYLVVGIGINVNNQLPKELRSMAVTLKELCGDVSRPLLVKKVLEKFEDYYLLWRQKGAGVIVKECRKLSAVLGRMVKMTTSEGVIIAEAVDINDQGALVLKLKNKTFREILAGEVTLNW
jgi:BirA family transcriptional regulator, biotin operon repressor / biotin---[acetyl-CoA-carboxylase] ligase